MKAINQENSSTDSIHKLEKEYFELRIEQEYSLSKFKKDQSIQKVQLKKNIKKLKGVSQTRINSAITLIKKLAHKSVKERTDETFELIISSMERSFLRHYENAESEIKEYIKSIYELQDDLKLFRKEKKKIFNGFKKRVKSYNIDLTMLNLAYNEFKATISYIKKEDISLAEYNIRVSKYTYLNKLAESFIVSEYNQLQELKHEKEQEKENKRLEQELYLKTLNEMFGLETKKEVSNDESMIFDILNDMFSNGELSYE